MNKPKVVVAGLGDSGILTAIRLAQHAEVVGISTKPGLLSGQELGVRLARPADWARDYWIAFDRFRALDAVRTVQAELVGLDLAQRTVALRNPDGSSAEERYDVLVVATGVSNGFWRQPVMQTEADIEAALRAQHARLAGSSSIVVIGGGAAAVSSAANLAGRWPDKRIDLYFPGERALLGHHPRVWDRVRSRMPGVGLHPGHRARLPARLDEITDAPVEFSTGQPPIEADAVLWAVGRVRPNTGWLPAELLDADSFVRVGPDLRAHSRVLAIGDVAATDPLRSSARNRADGLLAHNVRAVLSGAELKHYRVPEHRWGSVLGIQPDGLEVFAPNGFAFRFPAWSINRVLQPWIVRRGIYHGVRDQAARYP